MRRERSAGSRDPSWATALANMNQLPPPEKRRKTVIDSFQSMCLSNTDAVVSYGISATGSVIPTKSLPTTIPNDDSAVTVDVSSDDDEEMPSEQDLETKKLLYQLAFGNDAAATSTMKDPVDIKLEELIRQSRRKVASGDDFDVQTPYSRGSSFSTMEMDEMPTNTRPRSNSLPNDWRGPSVFAEDVDMDL